MWLSLARALRSGRRGRRFKSGHPDHFTLSEFLPEKFSGIRPVFLRGFFKTSSEKNSKLQGSLKSISIFFSFKRRFVSSLPLLQYLGLFRLSFAFLRMISSSLARYIFFQYRCAGLSASKETRERKIIFIFLISRSCPVFKNYITSVKKLLI